MDTPECRHQHIRTDWRKQNHAKGNTWARALGLNHTLKESQDTVSPNPNPEPLRKANKLPTIMLAQARLPRYISEKSRRMRAFSHGLARFVRLFSTVTTANVQRQGRCRQLQHRLSLVHSKGGSEHRKTGNVLSLQINRTVPSCFIICLL